MTCTKFQIGDKVRENRQNAPTETVIDIRGNMLVTDSGIGNLLHVTKAVKVASA